MNEVTRSDEHGFAKIGCNHVPNVRRERASRVPATGCDIQSQPVWLRRDDIPGWLKASANDHATILDALAAEDAEAARAAMVTHIENAGELLAAHFDGAVVDGRKRARARAARG